MTQHGPRLAATAVCLLTIAVGSAFVRLESNRQGQLARQTARELGLVRAARFEQEITRLWAAAFAASQIVAGASTLEHVAPAILAANPAVDFVGVVVGDAIHESHPPGSWLTAGQPLAECSSRLLQQTDKPPETALDILGPLGSPALGSAIVGCLPMKPLHGEPRAIVVGTSLTELTRRAEIEELDRRGYDYTLLVPNRRFGTVPLLRSTEFELIEPTEVEVRVSNSSWRLRLAPRAGWQYGSHTRRGVILSGVVGLFLGIWLYDVLRRPTRLRHEIETRTRRLVEVNRQVTAEVFQRQRVELQLLHDASHDPLTGLRNRAFLLGQIGRAIAQLSQIPVRAVSLLVIGLDRFADYNDSRGPAAGDQLLIAAANRIERSVRAEDVAVRLGGDEFAVLVVDADQSEPARIAERVLANLRQPFTIDSKESHISASIGLFTSCGVARADDLLQDAHLALRRAKVGGGNRIDSFVEEMHARAIERGQVETDLRRAVTSGEIRAFFEPVISVPTGRIISFEALARWQHPQKGLVSPGVFIPVAESTGLVVQVDRCVWRAAASRLRQLHQEMPEAQALTVSVNLSARQLVEPDLVEAVASVITTSGLPAASLRLEITESMMIDRFAIVGPLLKELKSLGVRLLLDDFGTGYSSLSYLHELPVDVIKVDRSFISVLPQGGKHVEIVRAIVSLGEQLGLDVIAEGLSNEDELDCLRDLGCPYAQGWLFSRPIPGEDLNRLLLEQRTWRRRTTAA